MLEPLREILNKTAVNNLGEKVTLVAAVKTVAPDAVNLAIRQGITDIGENKVQEFLDKYNLIDGANRHFIGHLQTNKVKYLIGKTYLIHSGDRLELLKEIDRLSQRKEEITDVLLQVNIAKESTKGGFFAEELPSALEAVSALRHIRLKGLMAMFPNTDDKKYIAELCLQMRGLYDKIKENRKGFDNVDFEFLSMGMSNDYETAVQNGSNMIRLGRAIFGERNYAMAEKSLNGV